MVAPLNNYLFGDNFKRLHGMSVDQALSGKVANINDALMTPEEYDDAWSGSRIGKGMRPFAESHAELIKPTDVSRTVRNFQREYGEHLIGNPHRVAAGSTSFVIPKSHVTEGRVTHLGQQFINPEPPKKPRKGSKAYDEMMKQNNSEPKKITATTSFVVKPTK